MHDAHPFSKPAATYSSCLQLCGVYGASRHTSARRGYTYGRSARPLSVPLGGHEASKLCKQAGDVEEVRVHGVLPGVACLKGLLQLILVSLQYYAICVRFET